MEESGLHNAKFMMKLWIWPLHDDHNNQNNIKKKIWYKVQAIHEKNNALYKKVGTREAVLLTRKAVERVNRLVEVPRFDVHGSGT